MVKRRKITAKEFHADQSADGILLVKGYSCEVEKAADGDATAAINFVISTGEVDRDGDTVNPHGFTNLDTFHETGVNLWAHDSYLPPIGKPGPATVEDGKVRSSITFNPPDMGHPLGDGFGETVRRMFVEGILKSVSIGFIPKSWVESERDQWGLDFSTQELLEFSPVPIPSNRGAMVELGRKGVVDLRPIYKWTEHAMDNGGSLLVPDDEIVSLHDELSAECKGAPVVIDMAPSAPAEPAPKAATLAEQIEATEDEAELLSLKSIIDRKLATIKQAKLSAPLDIDPAAALMLPDWIRAETKRALEGSAQEQKQ
jgi:hypothetical protein